MENQDKDLVLRDGEYAEQDYQDTTEEPTEKNETDEFYEAPKGTKMVWSVLGLVLSILSIALMRFYYVALPMAVVALLSALLSRKKIGYFDKMTVFAIIFSIFGIVFSVFVMAMDLTGVLDAIFKK